MIVQNHELRVTGEKCKRKEDEEESVFLNGHGGVIKAKQMTRDAQLQVLQREYGNHIPQTFLRPGLKVVYSAPFPADLRPYPQ